MGYCHSCPHDIMNQTPHQIKAGCGHLVYICDDCSPERRHVRHNKCIKCNGGKTPDELMAEDAAIVDEYNYYPDFIIDDGFSELFAYTDVDVDLDADNDQFDDKDYP